VSSQNFNTNLIEKTIGKISDKEGLNKALEKRVGRLCHPEAQFPEGRKKSKHHQKRK